jgi:hypothetical protein
MTGSPAWEVAIALRSIPACGYLLIGRICARLNITSQHKFAPNEEGQDLSSLVETRSTVGMVSRE